MTPKEQAAMQQALEALREYRDTQMIFAPRKAITALREALDHSGEANEMVGCAYCNNPLFAGTKCNNCGRVTLAEQAEQSEQEPVAEVVVRPLRGDQSQPTTDIKWLQRPKTGKLYAAPVHIKDLTEYELDELRFQNLNYLDYARAVIAKDREKNK